MAAISIEVGDDGKIAGDLPDALKAHVQSQIDAAKKSTAEEITQREFNAGFAKGMSKKAEELKGLIVDPAERERTKTLEKELEDRKIADLEQAKKYTEAAQIREDRFQKELREKDEAITKRHGKLAAGARAEIKAAASKFGARDESLGELAQLLGGEVDFDENLDPYVKGSDGKPAVDSKGQPLTIEGRVKQYLAANRHHVKGPGGAGGGAPGGASLDNLSDATVDAQARVDAAQKAYDANPRDNNLLLALHRAQQALATAKTKG